jgi:hypothetical protein
VSNHCCRGRFLVSYADLTASEGCECSAFAGGEAEHKCPDKGGNLMFDSLFDHAVFFGVVFEHCRWKECSDDSQFDMRWELTRTLPPIPVAKKY